MAVTSVEETFSDHWPTPTMSCMAEPDDRREPLDLGMLTPATDAKGTATASSPSESAPPDPGRSAMPWRPYVAIGLALAIGVTVGVIATEARENTAQSQQVELHPGPLSFSTEDGTPSSVDFTLLNAGPDVVDIVDITVPGWNRDEDAGEPTTGTVEPGEWVTFTIYGWWQCDADRSGDVEVTARTESSDPSTSALNLAEASRRDLDNSRRLQCETVEGADPWLHHASAVTITAPDTVTVTIPVGNRIDRPTHIIAVASATPGFEVRSPDIPLVLSANESASMTLSWTLSDCAAAEGIEQPAIALDTKSGPSQRRTEYNVEPAVLVELVRVTERTCRT